MPRVILLYPYVSIVLRARVTVLMTTMSAVGALIAQGFPPPLAAAMTLACIVGGVEIGRQLTWPYFAPRTRVYVLVVIVVLVVNAVRFGCPAPQCFACVLGGGWCTAVLARWVTRLAFRPHSRTA